MAIPSFYVQTFRRYPLDSTTPAGAVRCWRITHRRYWGHGVPKMAPAGWLAPVGISEHSPTLVSEWHTERHALNVMRSLEREQERLWSLSAREDRARRERTGEIFSHPAAIAFHTSVDQSVAVGGSRAGQWPRWRRMTLVTRTRDGVTFTEDIAIERFWSAPSHTVSS